MIQMPLIKDWQNKLQDIHTMEKASLFMKREIDLYVERYLRHDVNIQSDIPGMVLPCKHT